MLALARLAAEPQPGAILGSFILAAALSLLSWGAWGQSPEQRGLEVASEAARRDAGFGDYQAEMRMRLRNRQGDESEREMRIRVLEVADDGDKSLILFDRPRDVKGTALLTFSHKAGADDQWLYLPALKRVKRIAARNKSGPFVGSEFAFEDLVSQEVEKYRYRFVREEVLDGMPVFLVERYPKDSYSGYRRQLVWIDRAEYRVHQVEFYDRKDSLLKTLAFRGYRRYLDRFWRPDEMYMENHQTGKTTLLSWRNYRFRTGLGDADFNRNSLKRAW